MSKGIIERYSNYLPVSEKTPRVTLGEGNTSLLYADSLSELLSAHVYMKVEGLNPTGSFKDRGMAMAVAKAQEKGAKAIICASTGNTSASAAAYAARAGMECFVVIPHGYVALGKLAQAIHYGAKIISVEGNFDQALEIVRQLGEKYPLEIVNSINPYRLEGQKSASFEIIEQLGHAPDVLALPVGNAGNISAYWKGFKEALDHELCSTSPQMWGFEAEGAAAIVNNKVYEEPDTFATAIRIGNPASWQLAIQARDESQGLIDEVSDDEIREAYQLLAQKEGVFCEPASASSLAGLIKQSKQGKIPEGSTIVTVLTGNGLKDPDAAMSNIQQEMKPVPATEADLVQNIFGNEE
ncbi:threonine synthase [Pontibacillus marinus]|uniref:Threonine synthase n=1 Tax=Pontibacillus marinus BH030004 = DSM 16465 TaxID=1385511 RepID=A0A0A5GGC5_9BACI|nr:threonine synthase [Pontibacillus marinus]KGX90165.1 threonine synthase [Pontibacillus marinus BH030004 = DSM 16465]